MAEKTPPSPVSPLVHSDRPPESPTTARALDFDSDQETETMAKTTAESETLPRPPPKDEAPPPKPPRPVSAREQAENTLKEAFPTIEPSVIRAVLTASGGNVEPAFNALLGMTDPDSQREPDPPAQPPRPPKQSNTNKQSQLEADEMYARQLHEHFSNTGGAQPRSRSQYNEQLQGSRVGRPGASPNPDDVPWRSFIDDDLPEIRDNIKKGFLETQSTVNKWITNFKKKIDGEDEESDFASQPARPAQSVGYGRRSNEQTRRSADYGRYDADPEVIGDDFSKLELRDGEAPPRTSSRPLANPNLFRPNPGRKSPNIGRKVSFQDGPPEEISDMYSASSKPTTAKVEAPQPVKASKWQPLSAVEPSPVADNDPFGIGDSDDDKDAKPISMKETDDDEGDRLRKSLDEAAKDRISSEAKVEVKK